MARIAAGAFTDSLDKRQEKVITRIRKSKTQATSAIARIPPSSQHMFGGDHNQLTKVDELCKDLSATAERPYNQRTRERTSLLQLRDPTINAHPRVVVEGPATTTVAMARAVVVVEPARRTTRKRTRSLGPAGAR